MTRTSLCAITLFALLSVFNMSWAQSHSNAAFATEAVKRAKRPKPDKGNGETQPERDRRLLRECKGRPNAGACEGYAS
jgi:hypothetical protein